MHHRLVAAVGSVIAVSEVLSIDEMACELTGSWRNESVIRRLAGEVKATLREVGECLTCSIGIGPNRFLAKTASNMQKPDGLTVIHESDLPEMLFSLKLRDLNGIAKAMHARLERHGINTVEALCQAPREKLWQVWGGVEGERYYDRLRGIEPPVAPTRRGSIGHSHVLPPQLRYVGGAYAVLSKLTQKAVLHLRAEGCLAARLGVRVAWRQRSDWERVARFPPMQDTLGFLRILVGSLWAKRPPFGEPTKVSMVFSELTPDTEETLSLFTDGTHYPSLGSVFDRIRRKYANNALYFGGAFPAGAQAPMRISFTNIPDMALEQDGQSKRD